MQRRNFLKLGAAMTLTLATERGWAQNAKAEVHGWPPWPGLYHASPRVCGGRAKFATLLPLFAPRVPQRPQGRRCEAAATPSL
jgi:hypothetical protein